MKIDAQVDMAKLKRSLERAAKSLGETNEQLVVRWSVATAKELARQTQPHRPGRKGQSINWSDARKRQVRSVEAGMLAAVAPLEKAKVKGRTVSGLWQGKPVRFPVSRLLASESDIHAFIDSKRTKKGRRTPKQIPISEKRVAKNAVFNRAKRQRVAWALAAKAAWMGAAVSIAAHQRGTGRVSPGSIPKYVAANTSRGSARAPKRGMNPISYLLNRSRHSGSSYVLRRRAIDEAATWGAKRTLTWYKHAAKRALDNA